MVNLGLISGSKSRKSVKLSFRIPYYTQWGQTLLVSGSEPVLGSWNVKKGLVLSPCHEGDELVWRGNVGVLPGFGCEYSYYVVDDDRNVLRWEIGRKRKVVLPDALQNGELVELHDLWQTGSDDLPFRSAFKSVIFHKTWTLDIERPLGVFQNNSGEKGNLNSKQLDFSFLTFFSVLESSSALMCVALHVNIISRFSHCSFQNLLPKYRRRIISKISILDDITQFSANSSIYVIGSSVKLGHWKVQEALKLHYAGESIWQADCVMQKDDFPIKYPFGCPYVT